MAGNWVVWSKRNREFAPVISLHKHHLFYPTRIEAFFKDQIELMVLVDMKSGEGPVYGSIRNFAQATMSEKIQWMLHSRFNNKLSYLDRYGGKIDVKKSLSLQKGEPHQVYVRGFRNKNSGEAYITYWFFYLENFVPESTDDEKIRRTLSQNPNKWWSHEGDWEAISLYFKDFEASNPTEAVFSHHHDPKKRLWRNVNFKDGRILAIPALGSHANFFEPVRKRRTPGFPYTEVASSDKPIYPQRKRNAKIKTYKLVELDPKQKHLWLHFKGRWGQSSGVVGLAPTGPLMKRGKHFKLLADI